MTRKTTKPEPVPDAEPDVASAPVVGIACPRCGCKHLLEADGRLPAWFVTKTEQKSGFIRRRRPGLQTGLCLEEKEVFERLGLADSIGRCNCVL